MRLIGVDYGKKRIGLAIADTEVPVATPLRTIAAAGIEADAVRVAQAAAEEGAEEAVVGLPVSLADGGSAGGWAQETLAFVDALRRSGGLTVHTEDERLTTGLVESFRRSVGAAAGDVDKDAAAAAVILQTYLDRLAGGRK